MYGDVEIGEVMRNRQEWQLIDVRSPGEFFAGHIPGAVNIPLFEDHERARVGTLYKQSGPEYALKEGLKIAGSKMNNYVELAQPYLKNNDLKTVIHCWRGGKRSEAIQWLFTFYGKPVSRLKGGYKSFRNHIHTFFSNNTFQFRILGGHTGSGKTEILNEIARQGHQVIDLEQIARHKGSAFGSIGEPVQPTNEQFENDLYDAFSKTDTSKVIWLENESRNIGKVFLPESLWWQMRTSRLYHIEVDREIRLDRALSYYTAKEDIEVLKNSFSKIRKRLGGLDYQNAIKALDAGDFRGAAAIAMNYYDKTYSFQLSAWSQERVTHITGCNDIRYAAKTLIEHE